MVLVRLKGQITPEGQLVFDLPDNLPPGEVEITLETVDQSQAFSESEIEELLTFTPTSGAEVVAAGLVGGWEHRGISDPVAFVDELRRQQRERRSW